MEEKSILQNNHNLTINNKKEIGNSILKERLKAKG